MTTAHKITVGLALVLFVIVCAIGVFLVKSEIANARLDEQTKANTERQVLLQQANETIQSSAAANVKQMLDAASKVQTSSQVVKAVPTYITLPAPIREVTADQAAKITAALPDSPVASGDLVIPKESVKPFYDAQVACAVNKTNLDACVSSRTNDAEIIAVQKKQHDEDVVAIKGGSKWQRFGHAVKWIGVGAGATAAGIGIAIAVHH